MSGSGAARGCGGARCFPVGRRRRRATIAAKPRKGPAVLRDLVREHFLGVDVVLVRGLDLFPRLAWVAGSWELSGVGDGETAARSRAAPGATAQAGVAVEGARVRNGMSEAIRYFVPGPCYVLESTRRAMLRSSRRPPLAGVPAGLCADHRAPALGLPRLNGTRTSRPRARPC
ncbi:MAG: hypothetical protein R2862_12400 [Thermoanaerobaculia bacterium]